MSYQVIARKWRPNSFTELVGQSHVSQTLLNALKNNRLPHALLFTGPRGTGKTSTARILAKVLRCPNAEGFIPCNDCYDCNEISSGSSVDVIEIDGASNNGVEAIRELRETVGYMPSTGQHKIYIIDEVHMLSTSAFNALLKTLEEPPEYITFMMATTEPHKIPNTILSRCQRFDLRRIPLNLITNKLSKICEKDNVKFTEEALWMVARQGDGSMRDSESLLDQVITFCDNDITIEKVTDVLGLTDRTLLLDTLKALSSRNSTQALNIVERIFTSGYDPKVFVHDLLEEIRNLLFVKLNPNEVSSIVDLPDSELEELKNISTQLSQEECHLLFDMALKGGNDLPKSQDTRVVLEMLILRMSTAPRIRDLLSLKKNSPTDAIENTTTLTTHEALNNSPTRRSVVTPPPSPPPINMTSNSKIEAKTSTDKAPNALTPEEPPPFDPSQIIPDKPVTGLPNFVPDFSGGPSPVETSLTSPPDVQKKLEDKWHELVKKINNVNGLIGAKLEHTYLAAMEGQNLKIGIPPKITFLQNKLKEPSFQKKLVNYINTFWGPGHSIEISTGEEKKSQNLTPKAVTQKKESEKMRQDREMVENHPLVKATQKSFKTRIKNIKEIK